MFDFKPPKKTPLPPEDAQIKDLTVAEFRVLMESILDARDAKKNQPANSLPGMSAYDRDRLGIAPMPHIPTLYSGRGQIGPRLHPEDPPKGPFDQ